ncbi:hypothetical protein [Aliikangiella coralliicola]|uniref:DUF4855 domain-containing protein n=1 Tax=Aliikangiella coralliicola TaxID=2592383 RepID=A0A545UIX6_9GAMM|nr:hypothetical protein [Aliikangiella coralliicola]TQV89383.1 hypothetical protein FLL46_00430 [Aliikangiella coralliicola]
MLEKLMFKKLILKKLVMLGTLMLSSLNAYSDPLKSAILYVGPTNVASADPGAVDGYNWVKWSKTDIDRFSDSTNGFIIMPTGGHANSYEYANYKYNAYNPWQPNNTYYNYSLYIKDIRKTVQSIYESRGTSSSVYISMPRYRNHWTNPYYRYYSDAPVRDFMVDLKANVDAVTGGNSAFWDNSVKGFYIVEETFDGCVQLNTSGFCVNNEGYDGDFKYFRDVRSKLNNIHPGKELIWAPHYAVEGDNYHGGGDTTPYKKLSQTLKWQNINGTIFDRILMQPGYANAKPCSNCFRIIADRLNTQSINGVPAGNTRLGAVMELIDGNDANNEYYAQRLQFYRHNTDFTFYFSAWKGTIEPWINPFYNGVKYYE